MLTQHARRKLIDITGNRSAPIAEEGVRRIGELYQVEVELRGHDPQCRLSARQERSAPPIAELEQRLIHHSARVGAKLPLGEALKYIARYWDSLSHFLTDGRIGLDNDSVEWSIRPIALNRKDALSPDTMQKLRTGRRSCR